MASATRVETAGFASSACAGSATQPSTSAAAPACSAWRRSARRGMSLALRMRAERNAAVRLVPWQRFAQTRAHVVRRRVAEEAVRLVDRSLRMTHVAGAELGVHRRWHREAAMSLADEVAQRAREIVER